MQLSAMVSLCSQRLNEAAAPVFYPAAEIKAALNEAQRFFCLLTLALEKTSTWTPATNTTFFRMLTIFSDWTVPLRITTAAGAKVRPARLDELTSLDSQWAKAAGSPYRYAALGVDLLALYPQPTSGFPLNVTYARAPVVMSNDTDSPEVPAEYHPNIVDYAIYRLRQVEGAQEFQKSLPLLDSFLDAVQRYGAFVRARNLGSRYDKVPFELESFDRSKLMRLRADVVPERRVAEVTP